MTDQATIAINVDTFSDTSGYFVRTEIEARSVAILGPFPDLRTAQAKKADQLASSKKVSSALQEQLGHATAALAATRA
jgi:hypothetical protein